MFIKDSKDIAYGYDFVDYLELWTFVCYLMYI